MKKVLFATSALVATASVAAADVSFSGYGRFGMFYSGSTNATAGTGTPAQVTAAQAAVTASAAAAAAAAAVVTANTAAGTLTAADIAAASAADAAAANDVAALDAIDGTAAADSDVNLTHRFRLNIDASTESDQGVTFGARIRLQADSAGQNAGVGAFNGARFHAETGGFRLEVGNVAHSIDNMANFYGYEPGLTAPVGQYSNLTAGSPTAGFPVAGYSSGGAGVNGVSAIYSVGDFRAQLAYDDDTDGAATADSETISASVAYTFSGWTVELAYQDNDNGAGAVTSDRDVTVLAIGGSLGVADVAMMIADESIEGTSYGISGRFDVGAATAIIASISAGGDDVTTTKDTSYGIGFDHDLGGGVALRGMVGRNTTDQTVADLGVIFNF